MLTTVTTTDQDPWCLVRAGFRTSWHVWQVDVLCEVREIVDRLLKIVHFEALNAQVGKRVRQAKETMLQNDCGPILLLRNLPIDRLIREITSEIWEIVVSCYSW